MRKPRSRSSCALGVLSLWAALAPLPAAQAQQSRVCTLPNEIVDVLSRTVRDVPNAVTATNVLSVLNSETSDRALSTVDAVPSIIDGTVTAVPLQDVVCDLLTAPKTVAVQSGITLVTTTGFTGAIMGRLDSARRTSGGAGSSLASDGGDGMMALGRVAKAPPAAPPPAPTGPLTAYAMGTFMGGSSHVPEMAGVAYDATSGMVGVEYSVNRNLILGLAGGLTTTNADLDTGATVEADGMQAAVYLSYATREVFIDALAAYGVVDLDLARSVERDLVRSSTDAGALALAARGGYLFDLGKLRVGPIASLTYVRARIDAYTEKGNPNLTMSVAAQTVESLTGSAGIRFLAPFRAGESIVVPYLNVTLEHQFGDNTHVLSASLTQPQASPVTLALPAFDARDFGKIEGGLTIELGPALSASLSGASTFARDESNDWRVSTGLNFRF